MKPKKGVAFSELAQFVAESPEALLAAEGEVGAIRALAEQYRGEKLVSRLREEAQGYAAENILNLVSKLAGEFKAIEEAFRTEGKVTLGRREDVRIAIQRLNPEAKVLDVQGEIVSLKAFPHPRIPELDSPFGFKGGAARMLLQLVLGQSVLSRAPRDYDLVRIGSGVNEQDRLLAEKYMPDDLRYGSGVEVVPTIESYFNTRDLTFNEIVAFEGKVICSRRGLEDALNNVLMPTEHVRDASGQVQGKVVMKMLRLYAEGALEGQSYEIKGIAGDQSVTPFDIALHLDRVLRRGTRAAQIYINECIKWGFLTPDQPEQSTVGDAIETLRSKVRGGLDQFANLRKKKKSSPKAMGKFPKKR